MEQKNTKYWSQGKTNSNISNPDNSEKTKK